MSVREYHSDGPCPFLTCDEDGPHTHPICPECNAVRYGNLFCNTCREHHGMALMPAGTPAAKPMSADDMRAFVAVFNSLEGAASAQDN